MNCGDCSSPCGAMEECVNGGCQCPPAKACRQPATPAKPCVTPLNSCGTYGATCGAHASCQGGWCVCDEDFDMCDDGRADDANGCETDLASDEAHCDVCGQQCGLAEICIFGLCVLE